MLADQDTLRLPDAAVLRQEMRSVAARHGSAESAMAAVRGIRRRELFRIAAADLFEFADCDRIAEALSDVTDATIEAALVAAIAQVERLRGSELPTRLLIVAMGRLGGRDASYASDADVMFVHDPFRCRPASGRRSRQGGIQPGAVDCRCRARTRRWNSMPICGPRAGRARWCARSTVTAATTSATRRRGGAGVAAGAALRRRSRPGGRVPGDHRSGAVSGRGPGTARPDADPAAEGPDGV